MPSESSKTVTGLDVNQLKLNYGNLLEGTSCRDRCPICHGGNTGEKSFVVTRQPNGLAFICHRASCKISGFVKDIYNNIYINNNINNNNNTNPYNKKLVYLKYNQLYYLNHKYGLNNNIINKNKWEFAIEDGGIYMPIFALNAKEIGAQVKRLRPGTDRNPKVKSYWSDAEAIKLHFPYNADFVDPPFVVVVEDIISAVKVSELIDTVALLGTTFNNAKARAIREVSPNVVFALDPDTFVHNKSVAHDYKKRFGAMFDNFEVVKLSKDPKDCTWSELTDTFVPESKP